MGEKKALLIVSLDCICADMQSNMAATRHSPDSPEGHLSSVPAQTSLSIKPSISHIHRWTDCPRPCLETITFPGPFTKSSRPHPASSHPPSHPSAVMINPPCSHLCHRALLCLWFMGPAEDRTKGHRETDTKGGARQHSTEKRWTGKLSNAVSV